MKTLALILAILGVVPAQAQTPPDYSVLQAHSARREKQFAPYRCMQDAMRGWNTMTQQQREAQVAACRTAQ